MKLVILDRDGTINHEREDYIKSADEWVPLPGALEAIARLNHAGWHVVVATNQSGIGRGLFDMATLNAMHLKMHQMLAVHGGRIDAVFFCPHTPEDACDCRKPQPGLFRQIGERYGIDLTTVPVVGDSLRVGQILKNLIGNAIRYTETGRVMVGARRRGGSAGCRRPGNPAHQPQRWQSHRDGR